jgi:DNA-binding LacI/PurR family transcriptional regulator
MREIADQLGISRTTVSLILKGNAAQYRISPQTQKRVLDKAKELNFRPNFFAKALNKAKTGVIGVLFPNVFETFMSKVVKGIEDVLYANDYTMMLCTSRFNREQEIKNIGQLNYRSVDGMLMVFNAPFHGEKYSYKHIERLSQGPCPVVFIDRYLPGLPIPSVVQDDEAGAYNATRSLIDSGCTNIAYVSLHIDISSIHDRFAGYKRALAEAGREISRNHVVTLNKRERVAHDLESAVRSLLASEKRPDGFLVTTNGLSFRLIRILELQGRTLNRDYKIAKFGADPPDNPSGMYCIEQPHTEMGMRAARLLCDSIENRTSPGAQQIIVKTALHKP